MIARGRWLFGAVLTGACVVGPSAVPVAAQGAPADPAALREGVRAWRAAHQAEIVRELAGLVAIPNVATDSANIRRNAQALLAMLARRGVTARLLENPGAPPVVYGELASPGARRTIVIYAHYDGQPVDRSTWTGAPWTPVLRDGPRPLGRDLPLPAAGGTVGAEARLYGRSASDDKAPIVAVLAALDALRALHVPLSVNLKLFFEGEEEQGSPHVRALLERYADTLRADAWIFADGPAHQTGRPQVVFGVRGVQGLELTVYGAARTLHSGHYGNWAPNPAARLVELLGTMRDGEGFILIEGFYGDVFAPTPAEAAAIAAMPPVDSALRTELGLARTEASGAPLMGRIMLPALNIRGLESGRVGSAAANAIPTEARASIDFRLVPDQVPARLRALVEDHIRRQGWLIVREDPDAATRRAHDRIVKVVWDEGYPGVRTALDLPLSRAVVRTVEQALGEPPVVVPSSGGSLPMYHFGEVLRVPLVIVPIVNYDNNQHASNENLRIGNLWSGIDIFAGLLARLGTEWPAAVP